MQGQLQVRKHHLVILDIENEDQVTCGPESVTSQDLDIIGGGEGRWKIPGWDLVCQIVHSGSSGRVRFVDSSSAEFLFGVEL